MHLQALCSLPEKGVEFGDGDKMISVQVIVKDQQNHKLKSVQERNYRNTE